MTDDTYKANARVWRKRITQMPSVAVNWRNWTFGIHWAAPEDEGDFVICIGPIGLLWDMWP